MRKKRVKNVIQGNSGIHLKWMQRTLGILTCINTWIQLLRWKQLKIIKTISILHFCIMENLASIQYNTSIKQQSPDQPSEIAGQNKVILHCYKKHITRTKHLSFGRSFSFTCNFGNSKSFRIHGITSKV